MSRIRLDDGFYTHAKVRDAGLPSIGLYVCALAWSHRNDLDGYVPAETLTGLGRLPGALELASHELLAEALVSAGLFEPARHGYVIHDYADYQLTAAERERRRQRDRERKQRVRAGPRGSVRTPPHVPPPSRGSDVCDSFSVSSLTAEAEDFTIDTDPLAELARVVNGADFRSVVAWRNAADGLPLERAAALALEALRHVKRVDVVRNEPAFITAQLQRLREEQAA